MTKEKYEEDIKVLKKFSRDLVTENAALKQELENKENELRDKVKKIYKLEHREVVK